jgi:osmotically-inducible protein OsmY
MAKDKKPGKRSDTDMAGYDHSQRRGAADRTDRNDRADQDNRSGTYRDKDHDGGWSSQVGMDDFRDRSGGEAYSRMSRGRYVDSYGRGPAGDNAPFSRGNVGDAQGRGRTYGRGRDDDRERGHDDDRGFMDRAGDEVLSWFGDEDAARRRDQDHRGKGPKGYKRADARVLEDVNDRLTEDSRVDASDISVAIQDGEVTLSGTVQSKFAKRCAEDCTDTVAGVQHVQNNLRIATGSADPVLR